MTNATTLRMRYFLFTMLPLAMFACSSGDEDEGCQVSDPSTPLLCSDKPEDTRALATGTTTRVYPTAPKDRQNTADADGGALMYDVTSDDPSIVEVLDARAEDNCAQPAARVSAKKAGTTTVRFKHASRELSVEVKVADPAYLAIVPFLENYARTAEVRDGERPPLQTSAIGQVVGNPAYWQLAYFADAIQQLRGSGKPTVDLPDFASGSVSTHGGLDERDVLELRATTEGTGSLDITFGNASLQVPLRGVPASAVSSIRVYVQKDTGADGEALGAMARSFDADGKPLYGTPFSFAYNGQAPVEGDFVRFNFSAGASVPLVASFGDVRAETTVQGSTDNTQFTRTADILNCSLGGRGTPVANFALVTALIALGLRRARAQRSS